MPTPCPIYSFTIPSLDDDNVLDCRIYHPKDLRACLNGSVGTNVRRRGAVIAHPYAPLGGSYDDPVVLPVVKSLLEQGLIVGTFNFRCVLGPVNARWALLILCRGAPGSPGRTSWTGKPERLDYMSFVGLLVYYIHYLEVPETSPSLQTIQSIPIPPENQNLDTSNVKIENQASTTSLARPNEIVLLLGGYSYGSLILLNLPPVPEILQRFQISVSGTAGSEILLRAQNLSRQTSRALHNVQGPSSPRGRRLQPSDADSSVQIRMRASPMTVGGEETNPTERRSSREIRRSGETARISGETPRRLKLQIRRRSSKCAIIKGLPDVQSPTTSAALGDKDPPVVKTFYLLISPLLPPISSALCLPASVSTMLRSRKTAAENITGKTLLEHPTLAVFGSSDTFTSSRKLRAWAQKQSTDSKGSFQWTEIAKAAHFWREEGAMGGMTGRIHAWVQEVLH